MMVDCDDRDPFQWRRFAGLGREDRVLRKVYFENAEKILKAGRRTSPVTPIQRARRS